VTAVSELQEALAAAAARVDVTPLAASTLCDPCLGRLFAKVGKGTNRERGAILRTRFAVGAGPCAVCGGLLAEVDRLAALAADALKAVEFDTFQIGSRVDPTILVAEEALWAKLPGVEPETIKGELNREIGKRVADLTLKEPDLRRPNVTAIVDTQFDTVDLTVAPVFFAGRYRKLDRGIPQTRWPCRVCGGRGCPRCGGTGKMYATSVEEIVAAPLMEALGGQGHALHGMGREDIDARMLGRGRPFVVEISAPRRRTGDLAAVTAAIQASGTVEVDGLRPSSFDEVLRIKEDRCDKTYRVAVGSPPVEEGKVKEALSALAAALIEQRTPARVAHRRGDAVRRRHVRGARLTTFAGTGFELEVTAEAGTYVKELVHGDGGRTVPSLSGLLGVPLEVLELDVLEVHDEARPW